MDGVRIILETYGYTVEESDYEALDYYQALVKQEVKNFCNIDTIPIELNYTVDMRTAGKFLSAKLHAMTGDVSEMGDISSIQEGDTTVKFANGVSIKVSKVNELLNFGLTDLLRFRRLVW